MSRTTSPPAAATPITPTVPVVMPGKAASSESVPAVVTPVTVIASLPKDTPLVRITTASEDTIVRVEDFQPRGEIKGDHWAQVAWSRLGALYKGATNGSLANPRLQLPYGRGVLVRPHNASFWFHPVVESPAEVLDPDVALSLKPEA